MRLDHHDEAKTIFVFDVSLEFVFEVLSHLLTFRKCLLIKISTQFSCFKVECALKHAFKAEIRIA